MSHEVLDFIDKMNSGEVTGGETLAVLRGLSKQNRQALSLKIRGEGQNDFGETLHRVSMQYPGMQEKHKAFLLLDDTPIGKTARNAINAALRSPGVYLVSTLPPSAFTQKRIAEEPGAYASKKALQQGLHDFTTQHPLTPSDMPMPETEKYQQPTPSPKIKIRFFSPEDNKPRLPTSHATINGHIVRFFTPEENKIFPNAHSGHAVKARFFGAQSLHDIALQAHEAGSAHAPRPVAADYAKAVHALLGEKPKRFRASTGDI